VKDIYSENYETLMGETEDNSEKWKGLPCSWWEELILLNCETAWMTQIQCNPCKKSYDIFHRIRKKILKFVWKHTRCWIAKAILGKRAKLEESQYLILRILVIQTQTA
jgi:hypothetical protein